MLKLIFRIIAITTYYVAVIIICTYIGGRLAGDILYKPTAEELSNKVEPKYENQAERNRLEFALQGNLWGFGGGIIVSLLLRIISDKRFIKKLSVN